MRKIIELSSLVILFFATVVIDFNVYNKAKDVVQENKYIAKSLYEKAKNDSNDVTLVTFDDYIIRTANKIKEEDDYKKEQEYLAYLKTLVVYDGLTMDELADKLNRSLKNELSGYGYLYASYSLENGVDPYIAVAISLHETGCNGSCSNLMKTCNNVGGQKGYPTCGTGSYKAYDTLEDGIKGFIDNLSKNYFDIGLNTPELMNKKYAGSTTWAAQVNNYVSVIKSR